ncbi:MAG: hypothetical protein P5697_20775, partial [Limnospira sp. PMC 1256.20]|uniref:hypothetical protein n=1 Tax=unclassified Limnospira TaxID=2642885 RepID=UPI0028E0DDD9
ELPERGARSPRASAGGADFATIGLSTIIDQTRIFRKSYVNGEDKLLHAIESVLSTGLAEGESFA